MPYFVKLEKKLEIEKQKKAEREEKEREEEADKQREQARLAKKAARKERVMLERQRKAEEEQKLTEERKVENSIGENQKQFHHHQPSSLSTVSSILKRIKAFFLFIALLLVLTSFMLKLFPEKSKAIIANIPDQYKMIIYDAFKKVNENIFKFYERIIK